jgi:hypothetical protein
MNADIKYTPAADGAEYTAISAAQVVNGVFEMLTSESVIGSVDIFGEMMTQDLADSQARLTRSRAADILERVAAELRKAA